MPVPGATIELRLVPQKLLLSLVYATLSYKLEIDSPGQDEVGPMRISADMTSADASLSAAEQLSFNGDGAGEVYEVGAIAPGETVSLKGQLRLPLSEIRQLGLARLQMFVPLVRFLIEPKAESAQEMRVFTLGQSPERPGGRMMPVRLDLGPRQITDLECGEVDLHRWLPVEVLRKAG
jgi:hypothetical protein